MPEIGVQSGRKDHEAHVHDGGGQQDQPRRRAGRHQRQRGELRAARIHECAHRERRSDVQTDAHGRHAGDQRPGTRRDQRRDDRAHSVHERRAAHLRQCDRSAEQRSEPLSLEHREAQF